MQECGYLCTQNNPIYDKVAHPMNINQHLKIMTAKHSLNIQEVSIGNRKSEYHKIS